MGGSWKNPHRINRRSRVFDTLMPSVDGDLLGLNYGGVRGILTRTCQSRISFVSTASIRQQSRRHGGSLIGEEICVGGVQKLIIPNRNSSSNLPVSQLVCSTARVASFGPFSIGAGGAGAKKYKFAARAAFNDWRP